MTLPPDRRAELQRYMDGIARRLLTERLEAEVAPMDRLRLGGLLREGGSVARCECGETFGYADRVAAAEHQRDSGHTTWSIPSSWLAGRPWTVEGFWRSILSEREGA